MRDTTKHGLAENLSDTANWLEGCEGEPWRAQQIKQALEALATAQAEAAALRAENERLRHEATSMWRNGITNTIALFDLVRARHGGRGRGSGKNNPLDALKGDLDRHAQLWFDHTRSAKPASYEETEAEWNRFFAALTERSQ